ncbi:MAG: hypothetical protein SOZ80_00390 [Prevotella sp.]|uniref:hypothetical protein n=1 Tax=Prevotella sp. TaxID=59823 RepID=UPI002A3373F9|nr:hypothetical protein [Prevotella sp.]MDD7318852.1 hypothetical protein [Prevotellaceae bacterium]MDY4019229.1 hypothetical protein [Prevotella sp.]
MNTNEQTNQKIERFIGKIVQKFPADADPVIITDLHIRAVQDSGELLAFDDDDNEITRCVVDQWIDNKDDMFYSDVAKALREIIVENKDKLENLGIIKPYNFVLENDDNEHVAELYVVDDDTIIIGGDLMPGLDKELDDFLGHLLSDK